MQIWYDDMIWYAMIWLFGSDGVIFCAWNDLSIMILNLWFDMFCFDESSVVWESMVRYSMEKGRCGQQTVSFFDTSHVSHFSSIHSLSLSMNQSTVPSWCQWFTGSCKKSSVTWWPYVLAMSTCCQEVLRAAAKLGIGKDGIPLPLLTHQFSCDLDAKVEAWIRATQKPIRFFEQMREMGDSVAFDKNSHQFVKVPPVQLCACSWVCHDVYLNAFVLLIQFFSQTTMILACFL